MAPTDLVVMTVAWAAFVVFLGTTWRTREPRIRRTLALVAVAWGLAAIRQWAGTGALSLGDPWPAMLTGVALLFLLAAALAMWYRPARELWTAAAAEPEE